MRGERTTTGRIFSIRAPEQNLDGPRHVERLLVVLAEHEGQLHGAGEAVLELDEVEGERAHGGTKGLGNLLVLGR